MLLQPENVVDVLVGIVKEKKAAAAPPKHQTRLMFSIQPRTYGMLPFIWERKMIKMQMVLNL